MTSFKKLHIDAFKGEDGWYKDEDGVSFQTAQDFIGGKLGFCGCGDPDEALNYIKCVLQSIEDRQKPECDFRLNIVNLIALTGKAHYFTLYFLDDKGLTEHGSSVGGCWLTQKGSELLEDLTELLK